MFILCHQLFSHSHQEWIKMWWLGVSPLPSRVLVKWVQVQVQRLSEKLTDQAFSVQVVWCVSFLFLSWLFCLFPRTRSYAALRAADLDRIVGPGYSLGRVHSGE